MYLCKILSLYTRNVMTPIKAAIAPRNTAENTLNSAILSTGRLKLELMGHPADITAFSVWFPVQTRPTWWRLATWKSGLSASLYIKYFMLFANVHVTWFERRMAWVYVTSKKNAQKARWVAYHSHLDEKQSAKTHHYNLFFCLEISFIRPSHVTFYN